MLSGLMSSHLSDSIIIVNVLVYSVRPCALNHLVTGADLLFLFITHE